MIAAIETIGSLLIQTTRSISAFLSMMTETVRETFLPPFRIRDVIHQIYFIGNQSLLIIVFCVSFAAMVTIIESSFHMKIVIQNASMVPGFAALLILRELGAVLAALLVTSRVGAGITAEVGSMQITEQIDALRLLSIDPIKFLVVPRFLAGIASGMLLTMVSNVVCLFGAYVVSSHTLGYGWGTFVASMNRFVDFQDLIFAVIKGACFGGAVPLISCFYGFRCRAGAEGVGIATTSSVVTSSIVIIVLDFVLSYLFSHFY
ncbi:MAG: ABC transporter permease [Bdellovibrionales bacterium]|nr:ABC transporter permease [Bdellovibrionales bacterium]